MWELIKKELSERWPDITFNVSSSAIDGVPLPINYKHMPDPFVSMAAAAAVTTTLRFGMDVCLVTQREPLVLAKAAATLDRVSDGRFILDSISNRDYSIVQGGVLFIALIFCMVNLSVDLVYGWLDPRIRY